MDYDCSYVKDCITSLLEELGRAEHSVWGILLSHEQQKRFHQLQQRSQVLKKILEKFRQSDPLTQRFVFSELYQELQTLEAVWKSLKGSIMCYLPSSPPKASAHLTSVNPRN